MPVSSLADAENWLAVGTGALLTLVGVSRRSAFGACLAVSSAPLLYRGITGRWPDVLHQYMQPDSAGTALGGERGVHVRESIRLEVPVEDVYRFWRRLDNLPRFMTHLNRVTETAAGTSHWVISDTAHARGFRLEGYGVLFDVVVPSIVTTVTWWSLRTLDQNDLGLDSALRTLQAHVKGENDSNLEQALKRLELQMGPAILARTSVPRNATGATSAVGDRQQSDKDSILSDPHEAYRTEVLQALKDAMLAYSGSLRIEPNECLTIAAKGNDDRTRLAPADTASSTRIIRLRGADLGEFLAGRLARDEVMRRIETMVF